MFSRNPLENNQNPEEFAANKNNLKGWGTRHTFVLLGFFGIAISSAIQNNIALAIVPMIRSQRGGSTLSSTSTSNTSTTSICALNSSLPMNRSMKYDDIEDIDADFDPVDTNAAEYAKYSDQRFNWTEAEQGIILGGFYWGFVSTQYFGGRISEKHGGKWVFSLGVLFAGISSLLQPYFTVQFSKMGIGLTLIRIFQGCALGVTVPSIQVMSACWSPFYERSGMFSVLFTGASFGTALCSIGGGYLLHFFGWSSVFIVSGVLAIVWFILWTIFVFNNPNEHPRIDKKELAYIQMNNQGCSQQSKNVPWKAIFLSGPVWAIFALQVGQFWGRNVIVTEMPKYLDAVHGLQIHHIGWISALPQFLCCFFGIFTSFLSDFLIKRQLTSVVFTRRLCAFISGFGTALQFAMFGMLDCQTSLILAVFLFGGTVSGAMKGSWMVNSIDISPNFTGTIVAIGAIASYLLTMVAPYATGVLLSAYSSSLAGWQMVFWIGCVTNFLCTFIFLFFSSGDEQPWNRTNSETEKEKATPNNNNK